MHFQFVSNRFLVTFFSTVLLAACMSAPGPVKIILEPTQDKPLPLTLIEQKAALLQVLEDTRTPNEAIEDVLSSLDAQIYEAQGETDKALASWKQTVSLSRGSLADKALSDWVKAYCRISKQKFAPDDLVRIVLAETQNGSLSPRMIERDLTDDRKLKSYLLQTVGNCMERVSSDGAIVTIIAPDRPGVPAQDPLLTATAASYCRSGAYDVESSQTDVATGWSFWKSTLSADVSTYFNALVAQCRGRSGTAVELFLDAAPKLSANSATAYLGLEAYSRTIKIKRDGGERDAVAPFFVPLMKLWKGQTLNEQLLGVSRQSFEIRRIEESLLAARHRGMIGDAELAMAYANDALSFVELAHSSNWAVGTEAKVQLTSFAAEAYHLQAFRVALELREWDKAKTIARKSLEMPNLNAEWMQRIQWSLGLYEFLSGDIAAAKQAWDVMLNDRLDDSYRPMVLYWISRCQALLGNNSEADFYRKTLTQDYPLSFYSTVAVKLSAPTNGSVWSDVFQSKESLMSKLDGWQDVNLDSFRKDKTNENLLRRAEILSAAKSKVYAAMAIDEVAAKLELSNGREEDVLLGNYLSRLYAASGNWVSGIALITKLSKRANYWTDYPEQLLIYFPMPWTNLFEKSSKDLGLDSETMFAIARQETGFKADAKSPANAYGLVQLTQPTARSLMNRHGIKLEGMPESLFNPETNLRLGTHYVLDLHQQFDEMKNLVFAAYNAGEQAVSSWVERRIVEDPILFTELIPYTETRSYAKNVWRNEVVYEFLRKQPSN